MYTSATCHAGDLAGECSHVHVSGLDTNVLDPVEKGIAVLLGGKRWVLQHQKLAKQLVRGLHTGIDETLLGGRANPGDSSQVGFELGQACVRLNVSAMHSGVYVRRTVAPMNEASACLAIRVWLLGSAGGPPSSSATAC